MNKTRKLLLLSALIISLIGATSCKQSGGYDGQLSYSGMVVKNDSTVIDESYSASIQGRQDVDIFPQVEGTVTKICVKEGQTVRKGDILFVINQVSFKAALQMAKANVHSVKAQVRSAQLEMKTKQMLYNEKVISDYDLAKAENALAVAEAELERAIAGQTDASNNLSYTEVRSPSNGTVGTINHRIGALVSAQMSQPLTTVSDNNEMYVYFSVSENQYRSLITNYGSSEHAIKNMPAISLLLSDGTFYKHKGKLQSFSGIINKQTGSVSVRCAFPNPEKILLSGGIGSVVISNSKKDCIMIPQTATYEIQNKIFVSQVVKGKVINKQISVSSVNDGIKYIVESGLHLGDTIISQGVGTIMDETPVTVTFENK